MRTITRIFLLATMLVLGNPPAGFGAETVAELQQAAKAALARGKADEALALAGKAIDLDPRNATAFLFRGIVYEALHRHKEAVADFDRTIQLDPKAAEAYNRRGSERFKLGQIKESITDFDRFLELRPDEKPGHWKRGISYYYAGQFDEGRQQFEGYEKVDTNDVENAVWHYLCAARLVGTEKARMSILKIGKDKRVPMMQVYELYSGRIKPADVLAAVKTGQPAADELHHRLFYAHLYLGLYYDSLGDKKQALEHMTKAAGDYKISHYMGDVARVHRDLLQSEAKSK